MAATRQPKQDNPDTGSLAYWMGRVDTTISEMKAAIESFGRKNDGRWDEFDAWRREVDERLQKGSSLFADHSKRIERLEGTRNGKNGDSGRPKFGSWEWFRDSYLEKGTYIILSLALYRLIDFLVRYWAHTPK